MFVWTLNDLVGVVLIAFALLLYIAIWINDAIEQFKCKHDIGVHETSACDAICNKCGKNLGFIGDYRKKVATAK